MKNRDENFVSAVIYIHKGDTNTGRFLEMVNRIFANHFNRYEFICMNDGADEKADAGIRKFKKCHEDVIVSVIHMGFQHGLEAAMNAGVDFSIGDFVFEFDSTYIDYEDKLIMDVYHKALDGNDIVAAVPPASDSKMASRMFYYVYNHFSDTKYDIRTERFRVISRRAINRVCAYGKTIPYRKAVYHSSGLQVAGIQYEIIREKDGLRYEDTKKSNTALDALVIFTSFAYKFSMFLSVAMAVFMIASGIYTGVSYFRQNKPVEGWAPIMGLISLGFFAIFTVLTMIIKYLDILLRFVFKKQKYLISSIEKL